MSKKKGQKKVGKNEQMDLMEVGPENGKPIIDAVRIYKRHQKDRLAALKLETEWKQKILALVKEAKLTPLKDGVIKFTYDKVIIKVTPRDVLITIKEVKPKKSKKGKDSVKDQVETEEQQEEGKKKK